ncbi:MAG: hypothetical protein OJF52_001144 [Nitrospira sp.]|nr:MAG: hypothetical protein OJF52_001144 [Nitrospira sp.]
MSSMRLYRSVGLRLIVLGLLLMALVACDGTQTVSLTAEDFRFVPDLVRVSASSPISLSVYNAGREVHEFDSPILLYAAQVQPPAVITQSTGPGILIPPGKSLQLVMAPPPGTYLYICRRKGHADMTGTLIVE